MSGRNELPVAHLGETMFKALAVQQRLMARAAAIHLEHGSETFTKRQAAFREAGRAVGEAMRKAGAEGRLMDHWTGYVRDASERAVLTVDTLRKRGDIFHEHEAAGSPPVLVYEYEVVLDGKDLPRPANYMLLAIKPPQGGTTYPWKRPYVIIDPRAGHGPGIGGFKLDSQVGVALKDGHPVYFVAFRPMPEPGQTIASVTHAEAAFLREIHRRHPDAPRPVVVGNCQGGWATAILAAMNPDLAGPIVLNGSPMSYWSGRLGKDLMRYNGGVVGGVTPALLMADLGGGLFDGAHLVYNFEMLNPARTWFRKYYDLYADVDDGEQRFLDFERWWGGFFLMNEAEIRWIVETLFIGNKLGKGEARIETGRPIDLKQIRAPIIVFASHGDNITPPQQALNWIVDTYADEVEIEIRGQRILYMVHEDVGHLGIFVSSSVARREHTQMASTLKTIEALPPGLYEMKIDDCVGEGQDKLFTVSFQKRTMSDILALSSNREDEVAFAAVSRLSESIAELYESTVRQAVRALVVPKAACAARALHPIRLKRTGFASNVPGMKFVQAAAANVRENRHPAAADNPFVAAERLWAELTEAWLEASTDLKAFATEAGFLAIYASPWGQWYGASHQVGRTRKSKDELRALPVVIDALAAMENGGLAEAVVRMLVLLAETRGNVRRDRLERSSEVLTNRPPFAAMEPAARASIIHQQSLIVHFEPERAKATLRHLLADPADQAEALAMVSYIVGAREEMEPRTAALLDDLSQLLSEPTGSTADRVVARAAE